MAPEGSGGAHRTPRSERPDTSPYGRSSAGENVLSKLVTPLRWGIGGIKKTVRRVSFPSGLSLGLGTQQLLLLPRLSDFLYFNAVQYYLPLLL
jgi:hypothetical protein